ncbi:hypothetical protein [Jannaschia formosa]|uniref:hypothetical protein n=1 Tax=Jannaschia formosa TaxID=2259592 RepID=UPI000E1BBE02|nr:hypothetical protein [Jannaschia formosa]TFL16287.1 hypothetical protein DR046_20895 [Jannaschia formosa]
MAFVTPPSRIRGLSFLIGGTLAAAVLVALALIGGVIDLGIGTPDVRIDAPGTSGWPQIGD